MKFFILLLLLSQSVWASGDKGNIYTELSWDGFYGGDAVVCRKKNQITSAELLDYVERDQLSIYVPLVYDPGLSDYLFVNKLADKLERLAPDVFVSFRREASKLATYMGTGKAHPDIIFYQNEKLDQIPDSGHRHSTVLYKHPNCKVEQLVIRYKRYNRVTYYVQAEIFQKLSARDRRGIILHEALYHAFNMFYGDSDSERTRFFHRSIMRRPLPQLTPKYLTKELQKSYVMF